jgi:hypothetical protein
MDLREMGWERMNQIQLVQDTIQWHAFVKIEMSFFFGFIRTRNFFTRWVTTNLRRNTLNHGVTKVNIATTDIGYLKKRLDLEELQQNMD